MDTVLIVEANPDTLKARGDELLLDGLEVYVASTKHHATVNLKQVDLDAVVLGTLDDQADSLTLLRDLRAGQIPRVDPHLPVLAIGADADHAAVRYYQAGADIALPSNASPTLIKGALDAIDARLESEKHRRVLRVGHLTVDRDARVATLSGAPVNLTRLEFDLLQTLAGDPHRVFRKAELVTQVWGYDAERLGVSRTLDTHVARLRQKLHAAGQDDLVQRVRGVGVRLTQ